MLFIDDDEAEIAERQEQRRARADHDARFAVHHRAIGARALLLRQIGVPLRRAAAEALRESLQELHRQRDLRQQDQHLLAARSASATASK